MPCVAFGHRIRRTTVQNRIAVQPPTFFLRVFPDWVRV